MTESREGTQVDATKPLCAAPLKSDRRPCFAPPNGAWDCHSHLFGSLRKYPPAPTATHTAPEASLSDYRALLDRLGFAKGVVVTSTVYGTDNRLVMEALAAAPEWLRGVAVIDETVSEEDLAAMHEAGVRGFRINLMQRSRGDHFRGGVGFDALEPLAARTAQFGWHAQLWCDSRDLEELRPLIKSLPVPAVIDHFGRTPVERGAGDKGFLTLRDMLAAGEAYGKISGAYRISQNYPRYPDVRPFAEALLKAAPDRLVWGTDWPHPNHAGVMPDDANLLDLLAEWCAGDRLLLRQILIETPEQLYG